MLIWVKPTMGSLGRPAFGKDMASRAEHSYKFLLKVRPSEKVLVSLTVSWLTFPLSNIQSLISPPRLGKKTQILEDDRSAL